MSTSLPTVRAANAEDADIIAAFNQAMARETESLELLDATIGAGVRAVLADESLGRYYVAQCAGEVAGCLLITFEWSDWRNGLFWWIQSVYVAPHWRRRGIFRALYAAVRAAALESSGACGLRLYVERDNTTAQRTYGSLGMHRTAYQLFEETFTA